MALVPVIGGRLYVLVPTGTPAFQGRSHSVLDYRCQEHWEAHGIKIGLDGSQEVPGLILRVLKQERPDVSPDYADVAHTLVTVTNSFTAVVRLVLLPGSDMIKVSGAVYDPCLIPCPGSPDRC